VACNRSICTTGVIADRDFYLHPQSHSGRVSRGCRGAVADSLGASVVRELIQPGAALRVVGLIMGIVIGWALTVFAAGCFGP
jgi:hypothetical protein